MRALLCVIGLCIAGLAACTPASPTLLPTLTLVPPTETPLATRTPPTATPDASLISAEALLTASAPPAATEESGQPEDSDPIAAELVALAQERVATETGLPLRRVQVVDVEAVRWEDSSLGCPQPEQTYVDNAVDGYRIELRAGDDTYIFHTDFDRLIPCDADAETVPESP